MSAVPGHEVLLERGEGIWIWDESGRRYLDATAGLWFCNVGFGRREIAEAAAEQLASLSSYSAYGPLATRSAVELASRVSAVAPLDDPVVFFTSGGSDAIDTAGKLVRRYWSAIGQPRSLFVVREDAYHGMNAFGTSFAGIPGNRAGFGDLVESVVTVPRDDPSAFAALVAERGEEIAAFLGEPVVGAGGVYPPQGGYWPEIRRLCDEAGALLVLDEVVTGFGRLGTWFAAERLGVQPDLATFAKGITSGYFPLGGVLCGRRVSEPFWSGDAGVFRHGYTYSAHATGCAVGLANLAILEREGLVEHVAELEERFGSIMRGLAEHPLVGEVRTVGLLAGVGLDAEALVARPGLADTIVDKAREQGLLIRALLGHTLQVSPCFVMEEDDVVTLAQAIHDALEAVASPVGRFAAPTAA
jgi:putrescine---pyruvate transaminase